MYCDYIVTFLYMEKNETQNALNNNRKYIKFYYTSLSNLKQVSSSILGVICTYYICGLE